ncbi:hypothetical protein Patl1_15463 [Pistacia atlantica]|uniref:Uncharacterized protein n=1 Tax=Pistacia atlantica TaxID=434234 RepID=A0ACC1B6T5_9ROSI|nr:hypothetical protein Patl1_15463 [Pistacia atlantica]
MAKKRSSWFNWVKKLFISEAKTKPEKRRKCVPERLLKFRKFGVLTAPKRSLNEATEKQRKHALNVAAATAEAAAHAAAEARKALRALEGSVRLQAIVQGRSTQHFVLYGLKVTTVKELGFECAFKGRHGNRMVKKARGHCQKRKDDEILLFLPYSTNCQERRNVHTLEESIHDKERRPSCRVEKEMFLKPAVLPNLITSEIYNPTQVKLRNMWMHESLDGLNSPQSFPRRSFCRTQQNINMSGDENSGLNSPVFPTYKAATQSTKAKARSISTPRQRLGFLECCFGQSGPYRIDQLSLWSSYNGESFTNSGKSCTYQLLSLSINYNPH